MEAVPKLYMLGFELRNSPEKVDFSQKLKQYIRNHYNEDPAMYASAITGIDSLRREAVNPSKSIVGCSVMKRYYCQLHFMASRFPMRENEEASVPFSWKSLHSNATTTLNDISLEMASILYNIGALHAQLGSMDNRTSAEGMKMSCTHFQCAAWAFQHIKEEYPFSKKLGLSPVLMSFLAHLSLAQAQECILEKSMMDNRKSAITAKVGIKVVDYYKQSLSLLSEWPQNEDNPSDVTSLKIYKTWNKYLLFKIAYYESISLLFQGQQSEDQQKMGERVTLYQAAFDKLEEARKLSSGMDNTEIVIEALTFVHDVIEAKRKAAKNENEFIYHEDVPSLAHLPKIEGASLVKGISFNMNDPEVCGPDLFSSIVPMEAHESASLYSEEKAKILRRINRMIENKDEELETFLSMLDLDEIKTKMEGNRLPQELIDRCASLSAKTDAIQNLTNAMSKLSDVYQEVESMLAEIREMLKEEENHEKEYQQMLGKRPPSIVATDLTREAKKYYEAHGKASESNQTLHKAMVMHISNLKLLSLPLKELMNHIPSVTETPEVEAITNEMQHLVSKVDEMKQQRFMLASQIRDLVCQDDITRQVITYSGDNIEVLFQAELKKYDKYVSLIEQNLAAQENILSALKETYARYGSTRKSTGELNRRRAAMISSLIASYDAYEDLLTKSSKGLDFYKKLETNVSKLLQRVKGTCKVQDEEREQMLKSVIKPGNPKSDIPAVATTGTTMKLKDYLNIKKETGKLSLDHSAPAPAVNPYLADSTMPQANWIPGIRPAPVGSEETDTSLNAPSDTFRGFYQSQANDPIWANSQYSAPQSADQKLKFYLPEDHPGSTCELSPNSSSTPVPDAYPISAYSSVLPKPDNKSGYELRSNYFEIHGSPNRVHIPARPYSESLRNPSTSNVGYTIPDYTSTPEYGQKPTEMPSYYGYPAQSPAAYVGQPRQPYTNFGSQSEVQVSTYGSLSQSFETQPQPSPNYNAATILQPNLSYGLTDIGQVPYDSDSASSSQVNPTTACNSFGPIQIPTGYGSSISDPAPVNAAAYGGCYQAPASISLLSGASTNFAQQEQLPNSSNCQNPPSGFVSESQVLTVPQHSYPYDPASANSYAGYQSTDMSMQYVQQSTSQQPNWCESYPSSYGQQYMQTKNENLYTTCQIPNQYAMTNSDVYKAPEIQGGPCQGYASQYYSNQYGTYAGQSDVNCQNGNPVTYMQAGQAEKQQAVTTTTFSNPEIPISSPTTNPSNVDLLAGLDFNLSQSPLQPEITSAATKREEPIPEATTSKPQKSTSPETATKSVLKLNLLKDSSVRGEEKSPSSHWTATKENVLHFAQEVEKYEKFVEGLTLKTLNGPTALDLKWKEIVDQQEKISPHHIISVARCYPMKNRFPDILPYDDSRVELPSTKDDYINASRMIELTKLTPPFILTQAPLPSTYADFWAMVFEQQVEVIVCLLSDSELEGHSYWPAEKGQELEMGKLKISLQSLNIRSYWRERILSICSLDGKTTRVVVHLQFTAWPGSSFPESPGPFLSFSSECKNFFTQQRSSNHPVVVHCTSGVGRTGLFCLTIASLLEIQAGKGIPDLAALTGRMCQFRKSCLRDREHLKFAYQTVLYYCQDFLIKRGITTGSSTFEDKKAKNGKCHTRHPSEDFLAAPISDCNQLSAGMQLLQINSSLDDAESDNKNSNRSGQGQSVQGSISGTSCSSLSSNALSSLEGVDAWLRKKTTPSQRKEKFSAEDFQRSSTGESNNPTSEDPLSHLDPLWTIKK